MSGLNLDLPTLIVTSTAVNLLIAGLLWATYRLREHQRCFRLWALACLTFAGGGLLAALRVVVDAPTLTVLLAHLLLGLSPFLVLAGLHSLMGLPIAGARRSTQLWRWVGSGYVLLLVLTYAWHPLMPRLLTALLTALVFSQAVYRLQSLRRRPGLPALLLKILFALHGTLMVVQVLYFGASLTGLGNPDPQPLLEAILINHLLLATATALVLPLFAFTEAEASLRALADRDDLTGLLNRRAFYRHANRAFEQARSKARPLTVLMIDLDHFKQINDRWGHTVGDETLRFFAGLLSRELRDTDVIGRLGGEEFGVVLDSSTHGDVGAVTQRLLERITAEGRLINGVPVYLSASIGGATCHPRKTDLSTLLRRADTALYQAKRNGRNRIEFARPADAAV